MEQEEKMLNPEESLRVIRDTIDLAKTHIRENGFHFLLWGWLVVLACSADYYLDVVLRHPKHFFSWLAMTAIGLPVALVYEWRRDKRHSTPSKNVIHGWYGLVWLAFGISLAIVIFQTAQTGHSPVPVILILMGFATFVSGVMLRFSPLMWGAVAAWAGAVLCGFLQPAEHVLVQSVATAFGYLIPGYLLYRQSRRRHV